MLHDLLHNFMRASVNVLFHDMNTDRKAVHERETLTLVSALVII